MTEITNKDTINTRIIDSDLDSIGYWNGQEEIVLCNINRLHWAIYHDLSEDSTDENMHVRFKNAWDLWGSDDTLTEELSDEKITEMAKRC